MSKVAKLKELSFLVYGFGLSGRSVVKFFKKTKIKNYKIWDDNKKNIFKKNLAKNLNTILRQVDYIVLTPGISLKKNKNLQKFKDKIITDIDLFYLINNKCKSIVVTGTNGKSTTCKLIEHLLKKSKINCALGGNIGKPILDLIKFKDGIIIIEASSFQLSHSKFIHPNYAFFLNLTNDHLDWHGSMKNYLKSKLKIFQLQKKNDYAIINDNFKIIFKKRKFLGKIIVPNVNHYKKIKSKIKNIYLSSSINDQNMSFVFAFSQVLKIKKKLFINAMETFKGLPHRFEIFFKKKDITFINDSKATSFKSTELALSSLKDIYWIAGGLPKKNDKINISRYKKKIIKCYLIGKHISFFKNQIEGKVDFSETRNLESAIIQISKDVKLQNNLKKTVLFSPAAASFDQYTNFEKRGLKFKSLCKIYARKFI
jgi:UDP-N-acetylmuramoylalanine--D-glutamate ligase